MGCDIHSLVEVRVDGKWGMACSVFPLDDWEREWCKKDFGDEPLSNRNYSLFGWLADVRNYSAVTPISDPRGVPNGISEDARKEIEYWGIDGHSHSWLTLKELLEYDYDQVIEDRRVTREIAPNVFDGGATADKGEGEQTTVREHIGEELFDAIEIMKTLGEPEDVRMIFWFDN